MDTSATVTISGTGTVPYPSFNSPILAAPDAKRIRQALRSGSRKGGRKNTASVDKLYGSLIKQGLVRIVRKKGHPPKIVWIT